MNAIEAYWEQFRAAAGKSADEAAFSGEFAFEDTGATGMAQLSLVLSGAKTAAFSAFERYAIDREPLPVTGEHYVAEDAAGNPRAILEVTGVTVVPFGEIPWELARRDGEDESMDAWREKMREQLEDEAALCGFTVTDATKVVCELFRVVYAEPPRAEPRAD